MIRQATPKDIPCVVRLYKAGLGELGEKYKEDLVFQKVATCFYLAPCFLLEVNDNIQGIAGLTLLTTSHNGDAQLADYMFYIKPEHRSLKTLNSLVKEVKAFAKEKNLPLRLEFISNDDEDLKRRLLSMNGFKVGSIIGVYHG